MYGSQPDKSYDGYCKHCGAGYYAEIGPPGPRCPDCGKWADEDPEEESNQHQQATPQYFRNHFVQELKICEQRACELRTAIASIDNGSFDIRNPPFI